MTDGPPTISAPRPTWSRLLATAWRALIVGAAYAGALVAGGMLLYAAGFSLPGGDDGPARLAWSFVGGTIVGLTLGPIARSVAASSARHLLIWGCVVFFNIASVAIEGRFFAPELVGDALPALLVQQLGASAAVAWVITRLFTRTGAAVTLPTPRRSLLAWGWRFVVCALTYLVLYFVVGAINYALVTQPYYETHSGGLDVPAPEVVLMAELIRGPLIVLSVLPFLLTVRASRRRQAVLTGLILSAVGGLVPLTMQVGTLPLFLLVASGWEILFMNFPTGVVIARLLGHLPPSA